jgi:hypothetical protein
LQTAIAKRALRRKAPSQPICLIHQSIEFEFGINLKNREGARPQRAAYPARRADEAMEESRTLCCDISQPVLWHQRDHRACLLE